jgi:hypothetical protein
MANRDKNKSGNTYNISGGQQGAVGDHARAENFTQNSGIEIGELADGIAKLRAAMAAEATEGDQYIALGSVAAAEKEANAGNKEKAIEYLKSAGKWALDMAQKIGVNVITKAIQGQFGM